MAQIVINEHSQNYTYNVGSNSFATVALPITACWGPGFIDTSDVSNLTDEDLLDGLRWEKFPATQEGLEKFVATYRGPMSSYRVAKDYSYQMAMTLLTAGYDVLVCRIAPGECASAEIGIDNADIEKASTKFKVSAMYPGTFGNNLCIILKQIKYRSHEDIQDDGTKVTKTYYYWNLVTYVKDSSGVMSAVENLSFVLDADNADDTMPHIDEIESKFINVQFVGSFADEVEPEYAGVEDNPNSSGLVQLTSGTDTKEFTGSVSEMLDDALDYATKRFESVYGEGSAVTTDGGNTTINYCYLAKLSAQKDLHTGEPDPDVEYLTASAAKFIANHEWKCWAAMLVYDLLKDKLAYNPQRIISPGWDDQNVSMIAIDDTILSTNPEGEGENTVTNVKFDISPLHIKLMEVAYYSRCATAMIDIPKALPRKYVHDVDNEGYAQKLARYTPDNVIGLNTQLYATNSALFAPWGQYKYAGTGRMNTASPSFMALMIQRAMILNQAIQYEWALPTNRSHKLNFGKLDYEVSKKLLDKWQTIEGVGVNVITKVPDLGTCLWGNSTLVEIPAATYNALSNLSTRYLINAVENVVYRCGISITFQYNNEQAYNKFYAGVTPILDTMKNVGAIDGYYVKMAADINGLDQVNANTVIGKVYLVINGVVNDIVVDLIALPPGTDLNQFKG